MSLDSGGNALEGGPLVVWWPPAWAAPSVSLSVRKSPLDVLLATLGVGLIISLVALYSTYLVVRRVRHWERKRIVAGGRALYAKSKADRPLWVFGLLLAGCLWIWGALCVAGVLAVHVEGEGAIACGWSRWLVEYLFGFVLWTVLVLYKLCRKYFQLRITAVRAPHALVAIAALWAPYALASGAVALFLDGGAFADSDGICIGSEHIAPYYYGGLLVYVGLFAFFLYKVRRTIGAHHEVIRYAIFLSTSAAFPLLDGAAQMAGINDVVAVQQGLCVLAMLLVLGNLAHIFVLVLKSKRRRGGRLVAALMAASGNGRSPSDSLQSSPDGGPLHPLMVAFDDERGMHSSLSSLASTFSDDGVAGEAALDDINSLMADGAIAVLASQSFPSAAAAAVDGGGLLLSRARRGGSCEMFPSFGDFVDNLPEELADQVDRSAGYFAATAVAAGGRRYAVRPAQSRAIIEFDLEQSMHELASEGGPSAKADSRDG